MPVQLPDDVYGLVIENLRDDPVSLRNCSISSKALRLPSQSELFHRVVLRGPKVEKYDSSGHRRIHQKGGSAERLIDLLKTSPHLAGYVRSLQIFDLQIGGSWLFESELLAQVLQMLSYLRSVRILTRPPHWRTLRQESTEVAQQVVYALSNVIERLSLVHLSLTGFPISLTTRFAGINVKHLDIQGSGGTLPIPTRASGLLPQKKVLESLKIDPTYPLDDFLDHLIQPSCLLSIRNLKTLHVSFPDHAWAHSEDISILIGQCNDSLETLVFIPRREEYRRKHRPGLIRLGSTTSKPSVALDFGELKALKNLRISLRTTHDGLIEINSSGWLERSLATSSPNHSVQHVTFDILHENYTSDVADFQEWSAFSSILSLAFPALETLTIFVTARWPESYRSKHIVERMVGSEHLQALRARLGCGLNIVGCANESSAEAWPHFAPDPRWELHALRYEAGDMPNDAVLRW